MMRFEFTPQEAEALLNAGTEAEAGEMPEEAGWTDEIAAALPTALRKLAARLPSATNKGASR